jgi:hypothetical protein
VLISYFVVNIRKAIVLLTGNQDDGPKKEGRSGKQIRQRGHRLQEHRMRVIIYAEPRELSQQKGDNEMSVVHTIDIVR